MKTGTTDRTVEDAVRRQLDWDPKVNANSLGVTAKDGSIVLMGAVSSAAEKLAALEAAERVHGVRTVAAEISVELPGSSIIGDAEIAETLARQLHWNTAVPDTVKADVENGFVTLRGTVDWAYQRDAAERPTNLVRGIYRVTNLITVKPRVKLSAELGHRVREAIGKVAKLNGRSIGVMAPNSTDHVQGAVHSSTERRIAEQAAAAAPGGTDGKNEL